MVELLEEKTVDLLVLGVILKKLLTPLEKTKAYQLGLIDKNFKVIKKPKSKEEKSALTVLDRFVFKLKRLLGTKVLLLSGFLLLMDKEYDGDLLFEVEEIYKYYTKEE